eukprot:TRINITY_DN6696_c0_g1_i1.p1 TRINITY_DN6696_c0_g1~~TRINITY_DN6696_c0_g1_i1.p1  ORF type:complete len:158 (+),score=30.93 TRINITY_DN6696_c0_g1_i1:123-596(+)
MVADQLRNPLVPRRYTDQDVFNIVIHRAGVRWQVEPGTHYLQSHQDARFTCWLRLVTGRLNGTNETVSMLPYHLFRRTVLDGAPASTNSESPYILHYFSVNAPNASKIGILQQHGLWWLPHGSVTTALTANHSLGGVEWLEAFTKTIPGENNVSNNI